MALREYQLDGESVFCARIVDPDEQAREHSRMAELATYAARIREIEKEATREGNEGWAFTLDIRAGEDGLIHLQIEYEAVEIIDFRIHPDRMDDHLRAFQSACEILRRGIEARDYELPTGRAGKEEAK